MIMLSCCIQTAMPTFQNLYIYIYMCMNIYIYIYIYIHTCKQQCTSACINKRINSFTYAFMHACMHICIPASMILQAQCFAMSHRIRFDPESRHSASRQRPQSKTTASTNQNCSNCCCWSLMINRWSLYRKGL